MSDPGGSPIASALWGGASVSRDGPRACVGRMIGDLDRRVLIGAVLLVSSAVLLAAVVVRLQADDDPVAAVDSSTTATGPVGSTTTTAPTTTSTAPTTTTTRPLAPITLAFTGDMMIGSDFPPVRTPPNDGADTFATVTPLLAGADLAIGNLEGPITTSSRDKCGGGSPNCFAFRMPLHYVDIFEAAGFDVLNVANNHGNDMGPEGQVETVDVVTAAGMVAYGETGTADRMEVNGRTVSLVGFTTYDYNNNLLNLEASQALVAAEAEAADVVVVTFHGGGEGPSARHVPAGMDFLEGEPRGDLRMWTHAMIDAGATLVVGHGPHVLRGMEIYDGHLIAYSLGNFATYRFITTGPNGLSCVLQVTIQPDGSLGPTRIDAVRLRADGVPDPDPTGASIGEIRTLSNEDFPGSAPIIADDGTVTAP
jgi:poly-gamma-glutamate capsule biosynthesis protein CapA/YwtB (metallophosphatase superfamily)